MDKRVNQLMSFITEQGYECYIVGGYVRDYLLGIPSNDYDLCSNALPDTLEKLLNNYHIIKKEYGTITILIDELKIEITTYRQEIKYDKRKPIIYNYVDNLYDDLQRRDFTINTLCLDKNNQVIDLLSVKKDLDNKIIRMVGDINHKLQEDPLRILRALRFVAKLNFVIEKELYTKMLNFKYLLKSLSYERKRQEINDIIRMKRLDLLIPFQDELDISLDSYNYYHNSLLTWMMIDIKHKYLVSKKEKHIINNLSKLKNKEITNYDLYCLSFEEIVLLSELTGINYQKQYNNLIIKKRQDIDINSYDLLKYYSKLELNNIYHELEIKILNNELKNKYSDIMSYLNK